MLQLKSVLGILCCCAGFVLACRNQSADGSGAGSGRISGPHFEFSTAPVDALGDWCKADYSNPVLISGDPANPNNRVFALGEGVHKAVIRMGNIAASFCLLKKGDVVEVFTSKNFPMCLSRQSSYTMADDGLSFQYDNKLHITYTALFQSSIQGARIVFEFPADFQYGLTVHTCSGCIK